MHFLNKFFLEKKMFLFLLLFFFSSCITNSNLEYLRSNDTIDTSSFEKEYRLQVGDLLSVQISTTTEQQHDFFNKEHTSNSQLMIQNPYLYGYLIKKDGYLELPSFGKVKAEGFTLQELENIIRQIAISYFESPVVKLNIINFNITVLGEVNKPGNFRIVDSQVNLLYALGLAGDITQYGDRKKVKIIRQGDVEDRVFYVDLTNKNILQDPDFILQPYDVIFVSHMPKKFYALNNITNAVSLILSSLTIFLLVTSN